MHYGSSGAGHSYSDFALTQSPLLEEALFALGVVVSIWKRASALSAPIEIQLAETDEA